MIKKALLIMLVFCGLQSIAQRTITGKITGGEAKEPLVGVTVLVVGTTQGTVTDFDGNYSISNVPSSGQLRYTYTGYKEVTLSLTNQNVMDLNMEAGVALNEVVVTALGFSREKKALGYSVTEVDGSNFTQARENNIANALEGRIAGVNVSKTAGGPSSSSRVIIRGNKSLAGNNQPLYVVDGVPMDNSGFGQAGLWGGQDQGDGMSSINPDDIETITVLKGANAAALYGARAANGVINIITKRGTKRKGIGVEFNSNYVFETINDFSDLQQKYGAGGFTGALPNGVPTKPVTIQDAGNWGTQAWGPAFDGSSVIQFDGVSRPYSQTQNKFKAFYNTGSSFTNSLSFTGGNETQAFRVNISDLRGTTVLPNSGFDRTNVSLTTNSKFGKRLSLDAKVLYSLETNKNRPTLSDSPGNAIQSVWKVPGNIDITSLAGDPNKKGAIPATGVPGNVLSYWGRVPGEEFQLNPVGDQWSSGAYWAAYQFINTDKRDRVITSGQIKYDITDWLYVQGQVGLDRYGRRQTVLTPQGTGFNRGGSISEGTTTVQELNLSYTLGVSKNFGNFSLNAFAGGNRMRRFNESISANGNGFNVPFFAAINNSVTRNYGYGYGGLGINSLLGQVELGYKGFFYLTGTARNDWFSVLNPANNHILYPSLQASLVLTDMIKTLPSVLSYAKLRAGWAQVGNATVGSYSTAVTYGLNGANHLGTTLGGFAFAITQGGTIPNPNLVPLTSTELEFGADLRFFKNRVGLDVTYYAQKTTNDILNATISHSAGFGATAVNLGVLQNRGIEALINVTPISGPVTWDVSFNIAKNNNKVVSLIEGSSELVLEEPRTRNVFVKHIVGYPYGMLTGRVQQLTPDGLPVFDQYGSPVGDPAYKIIGNGVAKWTGGLQNSVSWKGFNASALIDFKIGGDIFSGTNMRLTQWGYSQLSLQGRAGEAPLTVTGAIKTGTDAGGKPVYAPFTHTLTPQEANRYWGRTGSEQDGKADMYVYDASFSKLRQLTIGYSFPKKLIASTPIQTLQLSFVGRNLAVLSKNTPNIDPESSYTNANSQGLDYFGFPATRSYGFNLKVGF